MIKSNTTIRSLIIVVAAAAGIALGACKDMEDRQVTANQIQKACSSYCEKVASCNDDTVTAECADDCVQALNKCDSNEQKNEALEQTRECAKESCDDLLGCTISAGAQCLFDISL